MRKLILLISFLTLSWNTFSQTATTPQSQETKTDSTQVCLPTPIARQVAKDLIRLDGCKEEVKLLESKIDKLQDVSKVKDIMLGMYEEKDKNNDYMIKQLELQIDQYKNMSKDLQKELKGQKFKSFLWRAGTFLGVISTSYLLLR
jgi:TolA-binding protein